MTPLKISYGHGLLIDCDDITGWTKYVNGGILNTAFISENSDYFKLSGTLQDLGNEYMYIEKDVSTLGLTTNLYPTFITRWHTSVAGSGLGAQIMLLYTDATWQYLLAGNASDPTPQFSTWWTSKTGTLTPGKTISKIRFYADDYPDLINSNSYWTKYDFLLLCQGIMTFPFVDEAYKVDLPQDHYADIPIIGRVGDETQWPGQGLASVHAAGTMDLNAGWKGANGIVGEPLFDIKHNTSHEPWQWFEDGTYKFKVTPRNPFEVNRTAKAEVHFDLNFSEYRQSSANNENYLERFGLV